MRYLTVEPTYGRDYKSKKELLADWEAGKDFRITDISSRFNGAAINKEDAVNDVVEKGPLTIKARYKKQAQVAMIEVKP